jgi:hypothetical protein
VLTAWALSGLVTLAAANEPARPAFHKLRYTEDWSSFCDFQRSTGLDRLKCIQLDDTDMNWLSLGGEARWHYDYAHHPAWGDDPQDRHGVLLQRYVLHADLHESARLRQFVQLYSALEDGRAGGTSPIDENRLDVQQAFAEFLLGDVDHGLQLRLGRQELAFGSARLVDVREGPNVRRSFQGVVLAGQLAGWRVDVLAVRPVRSRVGSFDDKADSGQALWGLYGVLPSSAAGTLDLYYLGYHNRAARYEQGTALELRHTLGARLSGERTGWDWNWELIGQAGDFGDGHIAAWSLASDTGYNWEHAPWRPRLGLSANIASGDRNPQHSGLQSFSALFPRGNYFSEAALLGPRNFHNLHPGLSLQPRHDLTLTADVDFFWRQSRHDGVYGPGGNLLRAAGANNARYVGTEYSFNATWEPSARLALTAIYARFEPGRFIRETGAALALDYFELTLKAQF